MGGRGAASGLGSAAIAKSIEANAAIGSDPLLSGFIDFGYDINAADDYHKVVNFLQSEWDALPDEQKQAIENYTGSYFTPMNDYIFKERGKVDYASLDPYKQRIAQYVENAEKGLANFGMAEDTVLYRGARMEAVSGMLGIPIDDLDDANKLRGMIGREIVNAPFMSTAIDIPDAWIGVQLKIYTHAGTQGMYVDPISQYPGEREFLVNAGQHFIVRAIKTDPQGVISDLILETVPRRN